jgi:hypothetical protein
MLNSYARPAFLGTCISSRSAELIPQRLADERSALPARADRRNRDRSASDIRRHIANISCCRDLL